MFALSFSVIEEVVRLKIDDETIYFWMFFVAFTGSTQSQMACKMEVVPFLPAILLK